MEKLESSKIDMYQCSELCAIERTDHKWEKLLCIRYRVPGNGHMICFIIRILMDSVFF